MKEEGTRQQPEDPGDKETEASSQSRKEEKRGKAALGEERSTERAGGSRQRVKKAQAQRWIREAKTGECKVGAERGDSAGLWSQGWSSSWQTGRSKGD